MWLIAWITARWKWLVGGFAVIAIAYMAGCHQGHVSERAKQAAAALKQAENARKADAVSADQRAADRETQRKAEDARNEAISAAPSGAPDAASHALSCERLRAAHLDAAAAGC